MIEVEIGSRQQQSKATGKTLFEITASQLVFTFGCPAAAATDQFGKIAVAAAIGCEQDETNLVVRGSWFVVRIRDS